MGYRFEFGGWGAVGWGWEFGIGWKCGGNNLVTSVSFIVQALLHEVIECRDVDDQCALWDLDMGVFNDHATPHFHARYGEFEARSTSILWTLSRAGYTAEL
jgi:hypothetical protein